MRGEVKGKEEKRRGGKRKGKKREWSEEMKGLGRGQAEGQDTVS